MLHNAYHNIASVKILYYKAMI